jgi:hypothetical protein
MYRCGICGTIQCVDYVLVFYSRSVEMATEYTKRIVSAHYALGPRASE